MHVFEVVEINEGPIDWLINNRFVNPPAEGGVARGNPGTPYEGMKFRPRRRGVEIEFPDGSRRVIRNNSRQALERAAVDWNRTNRPGFRVEPRMNAGDPYNRPSRTTPGAGISATRDAPTGDYDGPELRATRDAPAGDYDGPELRADPDDRPGGNRTSSGDSSNSKEPSESSRKSLVRRLAGGLLTRIGQFLRVLLSARGGAAVNTAINVSAVEDTLDMFMRAVVEESQKVDEEGRPEFLVAMTEGGVDALPASIQTAYGEVLERITQLILEAIISIVLAGGWISYVVLAGFTLGTGFVGGVLSLIAGGAFVVGGTMLLYQLFESVGLNDLIERQVTRRALTLQFILGTALTIDGAQEAFAVKADIWTLGLAGNLIRDDIQQTDSIMYTESNNGTVTPNQASEILKNFIKSDSKLINAYNDGKEEAKEIMRSGDPEESSD